MGCAKIIYDGVTLEANPEAVTSVLHFVLEDEPVGSVAKIKVDKPEDIRLVLKGISEDTADWKRIFTGLLGKRNPRIFQSIGRGEYKIRLYKTAQKTLRAEVVDDKFVERKLREGKRVIENMVDDTPQQEEIDTSE